MKVLYLLLAALPLSLAATCRCSSTLCPASQPAVCSPRSRHILRKTDILLFTGMRMREPKRNSLRQGLQRRPLPPGKHHSFPCFPWGLRDPFHPPFLPSPHTHPETHKTLRIAPNSANQSDAAAEALLLARTIFPGASTLLSSSLPDAPSRPIAPVSALRRAPWPAPGLRGLSVRRRGRRVWMIRRMIAIRNWGGLTVGGFVFLLKGSGCGGNVRGRQGVWMVEGGGYRGLYKKGEKVGRSCK